MNILCELKAIKNIRSHTEFVRIISIDHRTQSAIFVNEHGEIANISIRQLKVVDKDYKINNESELWP